MNIKYTPSFVHFLFKTSLIIFLLTGSNGNASETGERKWKSDILITLLGFEYNPIGHSCSFEFEELVWIKRIENIIIGGKISICELITVNGKEDTEDVAWLIGGGFLIGKEIPSFHFFKRKTLFYGFIEVMPWGFYTGKVLENELEYTFHGKIGIGIIFPVIGFEFGYRRIIYDQIVRHRNDIFLMFKFLSDKYKD